MLTVAALRARRQEEAPDVVRVPQRPALNDRRREGC